MKTHSQKAYLYFDTERGKYVIWETGEMAKHMSHKYILLSEQEVVFTVDKTDDELTRAQVDGLETEKRKILAEAEFKAAQIDARIQSLLAITHEPA